MTEMLALLEDGDRMDRCTTLGHNEYFSECSDSYTFYNSPASSCFEDHNVAAEVEISRDISDHEEFSFYEQCLTNLQSDLKSAPDPQPWANLADLGDTITEFSLNECRSRQTEGEFSHSENVCSDDCWNRCNSWVNSTIAEVEVAVNEDTCRNNPQIKPKTKCSSKCRRHVEQLSWNEMTVVEQRGAVENLTQVVSSTMGLREQLDVIRILNPQAVVSAADTEFEIDLSLLNQDKLAKIREYVKQHRIRTLTTTKSDSPIVTKSKRKSTELRHKRKGQLKANKEQDALLSRVYKQLLKEKRSGLFHNEQVISISKKKLAKSNEGSRGEEEEERKEEEEKEEDEIEIDILD